MATQTPTAGGKQNVLQMIGTLLKTAGAKAAESHTEAGGYQGATTHPSKNVEDHAESASEGSRSSENTSDVKEDQGAPGVDSTKPGPGAGQDAQQMDIGITSKATGEDPSAETESAKGGKEDGGTYDGSSSHPARTDNDSLDGGKYASDIELFRHLTKQSTDLGNSVVATVAARAHTATKTAAAKPAPAAATETTDTADTDAAKQAADAAAAQRDQEWYGHLVSEMASTIKAASDRAERVHAIITGYRQKQAQLAARAKRADEGSPSDRGESAEGDSDDEDDEGSEHSKPKHGPDQDDKGGGDDAALMHLLSGGAGMGADDAAAAMAGGGDGGPAGGGGGASGAAGIAGMGGAPLGDAGAGAPPDMAMLLQTLQEMGITPEELMQLAQAHGPHHGGSPAMGAGAAGGAAPAGPPAGAAKMAADKNSPENLRKLAETRAILEELFARNAAQTR